MLKNHMNTSVNHRKYSRINRMIVDHVKNRITSLQDVGWRGHDLAVVTKQGARGCKYCVDWLLVVEYNSRLSLLLINQSVGAHGGGGVGEVSSPTLWCKVWVSPEVTWCKPPSPPEYLPAGPIHHELLGCCLGFLHSGFSLKEYSVCRISFWAG